MSNKQRCFAYQNKMLKSNMLFLFFKHRQMYLAFYIQSLLRCLNCMLMIGKHKLLSYRLKLFQDCERFIQKIQSFFLRTSGVSSIYFKSHNLKISNPISSQEHFT